MPDLPEIPDAVFAPINLLVGAHTLAKVSAAADVIEPILGVNPLKREKAHIRYQPNNVLFATKDPHDTIYFSHGHQKVGQDRYHWVDQGNGMSYGYLMEDARA